MRVRCLVNEYSYVDYNREYEVDRIDDHGRYRFAHAPGNGYRASDFSIIDDSPPIYVASKQASIAHDERLTILEAKVRQLQDQLDHHDHKNDIDFTVEHE